MTGERDDEATMALLDWLLEEQLPGGRGRRLRMERRPPRSRHSQTVLTTRSLDAKPRDVDRGVSVNREPFRSSRGRRVAPRVDGSKRGGSRLPNPGSRTAPLEPSCPNRRGMRDSLAELSPGVRDKLQARRRNRSEVALRRHPARAVRDSRAPRRGQGSCDLCARVNPGGRLER